MRSHNYQELAKIVRHVGACALVLCLIGQAKVVAEPIGNVEYVELPSPTSPLTAVRFMFRVGSIHDPVGKEGLAALTARMIGEAGSTEHTYRELVEALYPMGTSLNVMTDREVTVFSGRVHFRKLRPFTELLVEVVLKPAFSESDFTRNKAQLKTYLTNTLRASNDELLGLEMLQQVIYRDHPYGHAPAGTIAGLDAITIDDVKAFYRQHYTKSNLMLGVAGKYPRHYGADVVGLLASLPEGDASTVALPQPSGVDGRSFTLIDKKTDSVGIHLGYPLPITRADPDYYPLMVANSFLGEHRTFHGRLMQQLRGERGLNYGDYSYIEYWHVPPFTSNPSPNVPRRQQYFSVWIRPVVPDTAHFALRNALHEVRRLTDKGLTKEEFELTRDFIINYSKLWAQTLSRRLGFLMDSQYYEMPYYIDEIEKRLSAMNVDEVNRAARKYIHLDNYHAVFVTNNADQVKAYLEKDDPSPMHYNTKPKEAVAEADKVIEALKVRPTSVRVIPVEGVLQK